MAKKPYRIKVTSKAYRGIRHVGKTQPKVDMGKVAYGLGADAVESLNPQGLEVVLNIPLDRKPHRVGYFPFECLDDYDLEQKKVVLAPDYRVWKGLDSNTFFFNSPAPDRPVMIFVPKSKIFSIRRLSDNKILYSKVKRESRVERVIAVIDEKIKKEYKPGKSVIIFLEHGQVPQYLCRVLTKHYTKSGWEVRFPADSRGDGGYIELNKPTTT